MIPISLFVVVIPSLIVIPLIFAVTLFFLFRAPVDGFVNQARTARYLFAYDNALEWLGISGKRRKLIVAELSSNIVAAAADAPVADVLARLGEPKDLAREYSAGPARPTWLHGIAATVVTWAVIYFATLASLDVLATSIEGRANANVSSHTVFLPGADFTASTGATGSLDEFTMQFGVLSLMAPLIAFALFSRPWRLLRKGTRTTVEA